MTSVRGANNHRDGCTRLYHAGTGEQGMILFDAIENQSADSGLALLQILSESRTFHDGFW